MAKRTSLMQFLEGLPPLRELKVAHRSFVITGKSPRAKRREIEAEIRNRHGIVHKDVGAGTDYLVVCSEGSPAWVGGQKGGSKVQRAKRLMLGGDAIEIIHEVFLWAALDGESSSLGPPENDRMDGMNRPSADDPPVTLSTFCKNFGITRQRGSLAVSAVGRKDAGDKDHYRYQQPGFCRGRKRSRKPIMDWERARYLEPRLLNRMLDHIEAGGHVRLVPEQVAWWLQPTDETELFNPVVREGEDGWRPNPMDPDSGAGETTSVYRLVEGTDVMAWHATSLAIEKLKAMGSTLEVKADEPLTEEQAERLHMELIAGMDIKSISFKM